MKPQFDRPVLREHIAGHFCLCLLRAGGVPEVLITGDPL